MARRRDRSRGRRWLRYGAFTLLGLLLLSVALVLPLRFLAPPTTAFMLQDTSGRVPVAQEWRDWPSLGRQLPLAVIAAEDQKFTEHLGFDFDSIRDSVQEFNEGGSLRGASTISQQLVKNLYLWPGRNFVRKGLEGWLTLVLEACLPKRRILEIYLNVVEFGPGIYGAAAASGHFFGKEPQALSAAEAALLAAVLPSPTRLNAGRPSRYVRERQYWILGQMRRLEREGWLTTLD